VSFNHEADPNRRHSRSSAALLTRPSSGASSYTATAPLDASSGNHQRHRLNTGGNRQLNAALHTIAVCQARDPGPGRRYYLRKLSEGKTLAEAPGR